VRTQIEAPERTKRGCEDQGRRANCKKKKTNAKSKQTESETSGELDDLRERAQQFATDTSYRLGTLSKMDLFLMAA
jgi:hypothetical protein